MPKRSLLVQYSIFTIILSLIAACSAAMQPLLLEDQKNIVISHIVIYCNPSAAQAAWVTVHRPTAHMIAILEAVKLAYNPIHATPPQITVQLKDELLSYQSDNTEPAPTVSSLTTAYKIPEITAKIEAECFPSRLKNNNLLPPNEEAGRLICRSGDGLRIRMLSPNADEPKEYTFHAKLFLIPQKPPIPAAIEPILTTGNLKQPFSVNELITKPLMLTSNFIPSWTTSNDVTAAAASTKTSWCCM